MLPEDMRCLVFEFDTSTSLAGQITFERWQGNTEVIAGTAIGSGFVPLIIPAPWVFYPKVPDDLIAQIPVGDRHRSNCLVWSLAAGFDGSELPVLETINQAGRTKPDRILDVARGLTYNVVTEWVYGRQSLVAGAIGVLIQE